ncbi:hypothetical protein COOONC_06301 [Cooperia oncophora]
MAKIMSVWLMVISHPLKVSYLSLHKSYEGELSLRWTPNQLMHASSQPSSASGKEAEQQWLWKAGSHRKYGRYHLHSSTPER